MKKRVFIFSILLLVSLLIGCSPPLQKECVQLCRENLDKTNPIYSFYSQECDTACAQKYTESEEIVTKEISLLRESLAAKKEGRCFPLSILNGKVALDCSITCDEGYWLKGSASFTEVLVPNECLKETCTDTDPSNDPRVKGVVTLVARERTAEDSCASPAVVTQLKCSNSVSQGWDIFETPCPEGTNCRDGACS